MQLQHSIVKHQVAKHGQFLRYTTLAQLNHITSRAPLVYCNRVREISLNIDDYLQGGGVIFRIKRKKKVPPLVPLKCCQHSFQLELESENSIKNHGNRVIQAGKSLRSSLAETILQNSLSCEVSPCYSIMENLKRQKTT